jgi:hypothetical protein
MIFSYILKCIINTRYLSVNNLKICKFLFIFKLFKYINKGLNQLMKGKTCFRKNLSFLKILHIGEEMQDKSCPSPELKNINPWERYLQWGLRVVILISGFYEIFLGGERFFGILALLAVSIIVFPRFFTSNRLCAIPLEIEILLLIVVFFELILADANSFYSVPYYDKFMHSLVSIIIGLIGMMLIYTAYAFGKLKANLAIMFIIIVLITIALGAILEMAEYFYDQILYQFIRVYLPTGLTQGSILTPPLADTMYDLYFDTLGGILGALIGVFLIKRAEKKGHHLQVINEIADIERIKK